MKKNDVDFNAIRLLHQTGDFTSARDGYLKILAKEPNNIEALHNLGILYAQNTDFMSAVNYFEKAIKLDPNIPTLYLNLGNALKSQGLFSQAAHAFQQAIAINPDYAAALNNLGITFYAQDKIHDAIKLYREAIEKQPNYLDAYYNLGLALTKLERYEEAISTYEKLIDESRTHAPAKFQLATLLLKLNRTKEALAFFLEVEEQHPHHFETQTNLATCYLKLGAFNEAKAHYNKALELVPGDTQILFNMGVINMQQGNVDNAIQYYQRALQINPEYFAAHNNLGVAFLAKNHIGYALHHFKEALKLEPNNKAIEYTIAVLSKDQRLLASPPDYIKNLFDAYADHYEPHLLHSLEYRVPELLYSATQRAIKNITTKLDILDLGCGTGLCGEAFKPLAKTLTGVDLSENMLDIAANKHIYDELVSAEFSSYLSRKTKAYDLIMAGDALVYIGDLKNIFTQTANALREKGLFVFNTEVTTASHYVMNQSGRFSHQKEYIDVLAKQNGFEIIFYENGITRQQNNEPVYGHLYVLEKKTNSQ